MAYAKLLEWAPEQVAEWLYGLDDVIRPYACAFLNNDIGGRYLATLAADDLNGLNIWKLGHQQLLLEAAEHLSQLYFNLDTENLQWLALRLSCKARSLYNALPAEDDGEDGLANDGGSCGSGCVGGGVSTGSGASSGDGRLTPNDAEQMRLRRRRLDHVTTSTLAAVSDVISSVKAMVQWLDRPPFDATGQGPQSADNAYVRMRNTLLQLGIELAMNAQRDKFAERPNTVIRNVCLVIATMCDKLIKESRDSLILQPVSLEVVTVRKKPNEELGMHIQCLFSGSHIIGRVKYQSPASSGGRVERSDEIVQVNYQTVVGWTLKKLVDAMKENPTEVILTLKKRPRHGTTFGRINTPHLVQQPFAERRSNNSSKKKFGVRQANKLESSGLSSGEPEPIRTFSPSSLMPPPPPLLLQPASTTYSSLMETVTTEDEEDDDSAFLSEVDSRSSAVDVQLTVPKLQVALQRRATVTGASPTSSRPPVSIDQLWHDTKRDVINRSYSYDVSGSVMVNGSKPKQPMHAVIGRPLPPPPPTVPTIFSSNADHDKVSAVRKTFGGEALILSHYETFAVGKHHHPSTVAEAVEETAATDQESSLKLSPKHHYEDVEQRTSDSKSVCSTESLQIDDDSSCKSYQVVVVGGVAQKCTSVPKEPKRSPLNSPLLRHRRKRWEFANRRISCKDLGRGDCQGWLHRGRARNGVKGTNPVAASVLHKWTKRWCVLKTDGLYVYEDVQAQKAECFLCLVGFSISPAPECKSKKYAFKAYHSGTEFYFASDSQRDMSKWMNKMGLAAISFDMQNCVTTSGFLSPSKQSVATESVFYSESEEEVEDPRKSISNESRVDSADGSSISPSSSSSYHSTLESPPPPPKGPTTSSGILGHPLGESARILSADRVRFQPVSLKSFSDVSGAKLTDGSGNDPNNVGTIVSSASSDTSNAVRMSLAFEMNLDCVPARRNVAHSESSVSLWSSSTLPSGSSAHRRLIDTAGSNATVSSPSASSTNTVVIATPPAKSLTMSALKLFGSPKFVKKFTASNHNRQQPESKPTSDKNSSTTNSAWLNSLEKTNKSGSPDWVPSPPPPPLSSPEKRFLRSPRLTRAFFSSKATSAVSMSTSDRREVAKIANRVDQSTQFLRISSIPSQQESDDVDVAAEERQQPQQMQIDGHFTFAVPTSVGATSTTDSLPRLALKPTMGVSMIGKQRRTSTQSTDSSQSSASGTSTSTTSTGHHHHHIQNQQQSSHQTAPLFVSMASQGTQTENG